MSLTFSETKIYSKNGWDLVVSKYNLVNTHKTQVIMPPTFVNQNNITVYCNHDTWEDFISNIKTAPIQPFDINLANYQGNIITRYPKTRTSNLAGTLPFDDPNVELFSEMKIDSSKHPDNQTVLIVPFLKGYSKVDSDNRCRLFIADLEALVQMKHTEQNFLDAVRSKLGHVHLITSTFFTNCPLTTYFGKVTMSNCLGVEREINKFIENLMGRVISSETHAYSNMVPLNSTAKVYLVGNQTENKNKKTKIVARSKGRLHFSGVSDEEGYVVIIGQNISSLNGNEINKPFITCTENKKLINKLLELVKIVNNLPTDMEHKKTFMKHEIDWVINCLLGIVPFKDESQITGPIFRDDLVGGIDVNIEVIKIINKLLKYSYLSFKEYVTLPPSTPALTPMMQSHNGYRRQTLGELCYPSTNPLDRLSSVF
ncbi:hypothetical protein crov151 [Cafeteria roenbergensis virus]|uniref:Uncharacterized protein n=1 Tax=Cafeteria roenbergensis virus (strain BV-PW1) TaxID=693272 RepID=E3T4S1_CROVB|nr:hypothetical protein crov151 [Cafeteria roenbergensis virus BV-PW1]ADO67184.1 hypothetical protein crov151 [Cafeteria roenbergensis virus BV-PW1]